jgi:hypothetical protein
MTPTPFRSAFLYCAQCLLLEATRQMHHGGDPWMLITEAGELLLDAGTLPGEMCS